MRKLSEFFQKKPENQGDVQKRELAFLISGGTGEERFNEMRLIRDQHPELMHRFVNERADQVTLILLTNQPLKEITEDYIANLANEQKNIRQLSNSSLALS